MYSAKKIAKNLAVEQEERDTLGNDVGFLSSSFKTNERENSVKTQVSAKTCRIGSPKSLFPKLPLLMICNNHMRDGMQILCF